MYRVKEVGGFWKSDSREDLPRTGSGLIVMWHDTWRKYIRRNYRIAGNSFFAGSVATLLFTLGLSAADAFPDWGQVEFLMVMAFIWLCVSSAFAFYSVRVRPMYPDSPLEAHAEQVERAVLSEWGEALKSIRRLIAKAEDCSSHIIEANTKRDDEKTGDVILTRNVEVMSEVVETGMR